MRLLPEISANAKIWIYGFQSPLSSQNIETVQQTYATFLESWKSHGTALQGGFDLLHGRFVLLALEADQSASGCSIDASVGILKTLKQDHGLDALGSARIFFEVDGTIESCERFAFSKMCKEGQISEDTVVYDLLHQTLGDIRRKGIKTTFAQSWHNKAFKRSN
jgi:hypothetical protein